MTTEELNKVRYGLIVACGRCKMKEKAGREACNECVVREAYDVLNKIEERGTKNG